MASYSKLMTTHCSDLIHRGPCVKNGIMNLPYFFLSNARYFAPVTLLPLILKIRKWNKTLLLNGFKYYSECVVFGILNGYITQIFICIFYHLMGGATPWTLLFVPAMIAACTMPLSSTRVERLFHVTVFQSVMELEIMKRNNWFTKTIAESTLCQTLIFMCCSAIILHAKRSGHYRGFWILLTTSSEQHQISTDATETTTSVEKTKHQNIVRHLLSVVRNYMAIGLTLDFIKMLTSKIPNNRRTTNGVFGTLLAKLSNFRFKSTALLTSYVGLYTFIDQYGKNWLLPKSEWNEWIAGFIAGISYILLPKLTLLTYSITQCVGILWRYYELRPLSTDCDRENKERTQIRNSLNKLHHLLKHRIPHATIAYVFALAYLVHAYASGTSNYPKLGETVVNGVTNNYAYNIRRKILALDFLFPVITK